MHWTNQKMCHPNSILIEFNQWTRQKCTFISKLYEHLNVSTLIVFSEIQGQFDMHVCMQVQHWTDLLQIQTDFEDFQFFELKWISTSLMSNYRLHRMNEKGSEILTNARSRGRKSEHEQSDLLWFLTWISFWISFSFLNKNDFLQKSSVLKSE